MLKQIEICGQRFELYSPDIKGVPGRAVRARSLLTGKGKRCCAWNYKRDLNA
jgi:hypothetical protein